MPSRRGLHPVARDILARSIAFLGAVVMGLVAWQSVRICLEQWDEFMVSVDLSSGWFMVAVAVGAGHSMLHLVWIVLQGAHPAPDAVIEGGAQ